MKSNTYLLSPLVNLPENFNGSAIFLHNIDSIPPHVGLLHKQKYYSLSVKGLKLELNASTVVSEIIRNGGKCVLIEVALENSAYNPLPYFKKYSELSNIENSTCLTPIKDWLNANFNNQFENCNFVFDVYTTLTKINCCGQIFKLNLDSASEIHLPLYSMQEIKNEIKSMEDKYVSKK